MENVTPLWAFDVPAEDPVSFNDFVRADIYTVRQVATRLGISAGLAYELVRAGEIPAKRLGRRWAVPRELFHTWLNEMPKKPDVSFVSRTPEGNYRANWREPSGQQKAKTFSTKTEAKRFLAEIDGSLSRGLYVNPHAGRLLFATHALQWLDSRNNELTDHRLTS